MGSRRGSTELIAVRSLPWPLGLAVGVGVFFAIRNGVPWLPSHQSAQLAQGFNQGISAALTTIVNMILVVCCLAALALFVGGLQCFKLLDTRSKLRGLVAKAWHQFEILVGEAFRHRGYAVEETGLGGTDCRFCLKTAADSGAVQNGKICGPASVF